MQIQDWIASALDLRWPAWVVAGLPAILGGWVCHRGLFGDRARGRRRCPKCWYDLRGTPSRRCPECGFEARRERQLHRGRRRWRLAGLGVALCSAGAAIAVAPTVKQFGWCWLLPDWGLLWLAPRVDADTYIWQPSKAMQRGPIEAEIRRRKLGYSLSPAQWQYLLQNKGVLNTRRRWPASIPFVVCTRMPSWIDVRLVTFAPELEYLDTVTISRNEDYRTHAAWERWEQEQHQVVGSLPTSTDHVRFDVFVTAWTPSGAPLGEGSQQTGEARACWKGRIDLPVKIVDSLDEAIAPLSGPQIDAALRKTLRATVTVVPPGQNTDEFVEVKVSLDRGTDSRIEGLAFGFRVELMCDQTLREVIRLSAMPHIGRLFALTATPSDSQNARSVSVQEMRDAKTNGRWTLRIRGDAESALYDWDMPCYWAGEFTIPLADVLEIR